MLKRAAGSGKCDRGRGTGARIHGKVCGTYRKDTPGKSWIGPDARVLSHIGRSLV